MKRVFVSLALGIFLISIVGVAHSGVKRFKTFSGQDTIIMTGATDSAFKTAEKIQITNEVTGQIFDFLIGCVYVPAVSEVLDVSGVDGEGNTDSVIVALVSNEGYFIETLQTETCGTPPCTLLFQYDMIHSYNGAVGNTELIAADSASDSAWAGAVYHPTDTILTGLLLHNLYFDMYGADSAAHGTGDTLEFLNINWWIRLFERE